MPSDLSTRLGRRVRQLRRQRGWQQVDLAAHADASRNHIGGIERGQREVCLHTLERVAIALDTTPADLLYAAQRSSPKK